MQEEVKDYIREHHGVSKRELMKKFGVSKKFLNDMAESGVFGIEMRAHGYPCQNCGRLITRGVYCHKCFIAMRSEMKNRSERENVFKKDTQEKRREVKDQRIILVIDPDEVNLNIMKFILLKEFFNYTVLTATSLLSAMNILRNNKISLMLLDDSVTSAFDGLEILWRVRSEIEFKNLPIIMMSAQTVKKNIATAFSLKISDYIIKPCEPAELASRVGKVLSLSLLDKLETEKPVEKEEKISIEKIYTKINSYQPPQNFLLSIQKSKSFSQNIFQKIKIVIAESRLCYKTFCD